MFFLEARRSGEIRKFNGRGRTLLGSTQKTPAFIENRAYKGPRGEEGDPGDINPAGQVECPPEEEVGDKGNRGIWVGLEPLDNGVLELAEGVDDGDVSGVADVPDILDASG
ncbi:hypothetical protein PanWU01x14_010240 [Parasponia andersonii]|uniref:Uncharacterized protein n=1 Tax=Parasponia andersonii TaxID=3476 RepID=A0A2P5E2M3_PARAD|nr:hypothetical protein PanWU01x14_010240 [Parasponia andersonii]